MELHAFSSSRCLPTTLPVGGAGPPGKAPPGNPPAKPGSMGTPAERGRPCFMKGAASPIGYAPDGWCRIFRTASVA